MKYDINTTDVKRMLKNGETYKSISLKYGISESALWYRINKYIPNKETPFMNKVCKQCGKSFKTKERQNVLCSDECRFFSKVKKKNNGCWEWIGSKVKKGYGSFHHNDKKVRSHRFAYEYFFKKEIPDGLLVCHKCDNPSCTNPDHLFLGTHKDNSDDKIRKKRQKHLYGENMPTSKLTDKQAVKVWNMKGRHQDIADKFSVKKCVVDDIKRGRTYRKAINEILPTKIGS